MTANGFPDTALVLVAHGSTSHPDSALAARRHAAALHGRGLFAEVREAFHLQEPKIAPVLADVKARRVVVVPLFLSEGFFTEQFLPRVLGLRAEGDAEFSRVLERDGRTLVYCRAIGTHPGMTDVILARAREVVAADGAPPQPGETALLLAAHGTERDPRSRRAAEHHAEAIRARGMFAGVQALFMEEDPRISNWPRMVSAPNIIVVPFFVSEGLHPREDIPVLLGEDAARVRERLAKGEATWINPTLLHGRRVWYSASIGTDPLVADVIMERVLEMVSGGEGRRCP
jgi:sirohydrochlorin cobaltochelatase